MGNPINTNDLCTGQFSAIDVFLNSKRIYRVLFVKDLNVFKDVFKEIIFKISFDFVKYSEKKKAHLFQVSALAFFLTLCFLYGHNTRCDDVLIL